MASHERLEEDLLLYQALSSSSSADYESEDLLEYELDDFEGAPEIIFANKIDWPHWYRSWHRRRLGHRRDGSGSSYFSFSGPRRRRSLFCRFAQLLTLCSYGILISVVVCGLFFPSYSDPPPKYTELRRRVVADGGTANVYNEKVYIAASLYDHEGQLLSGAWARSVLTLVDILGAENVFLSIYENNPDERAQLALEAFRKRVQCNAEIVSEDLDLENYLHVLAPDGELRLKRMAFLADVRNRALRPLENSTSSAYHTRFDKLLYLNDVAFDPIDAANLLFSTNVDKESGRTQYHAACAVDFINPFKFYDTFATRDLEGYDMGVPFYPWFTGAGEAQSRQDVLDQRETVRVKSCWGGMVAFGAKWFQPAQETTAPGKPSLAHQPSTHAVASQWPAGSELAIRSNDSSSPLRFRSESDTFWDASECCLIHADLAARDTHTSADNDTGIYVNPYIRVAYSASVLPWLSFTKRFERLYTPVHRLANWLSGRPGFNPRQFQAPGEEVEDRVWTAAGAGEGRFEDVIRTAAPGGFCGVRKLLYINEGPEVGETKKWGTEEPPDGE